MYVCMELSNSSPIGLPHKEELPKNCGRAEPWAVQAFKSTPNPINIYVRIIFTLSISLRKRLSAV